MLSFETFKFSPYLFQHWSFYPILLNIGILSLSFQSLEFLAYRFKHWNVYLILLKIGILT